MRILLSIIQSGDALLAVGEGAHCLSVVATSLVAFVREASFYVADLVSRILCIYLHVWCGPVATELIGGRE